VQGYIRNGGSMYIAEEHVLRLVACCSDSILFGKLKFDP